MNASFYYSDDYITLDPGFSGIASKEGFAFSDIFGSTNNTFALSSNPSGKKAYSCGDNTLLGSTPIASYLGIGETNRITYTQTYFTPILSAFNGSSIFSPTFTKISPTLFGALGLIGTSLYATGDDSTNYNFGKGNNVNIFTRVLVGPVTDFEAGFYGSYALDNSTPPVVYYSGYGDNGGWNTAGQGNGAYYVGGRPSVYNTFTSLGQYLPGYSYVKGDPALPTAAGTGPLSTFLPYNSNRSIVAFCPRSSNLASWVLATPQGSLPSGYSAGKYLLYATGNNFFGQLGVGYDYQSRPLWTLVYGVCATNTDVQRGDKNRIYPAYFTKLHDSSSDTNASRCFARGFNTDGTDRWYVTGDVSGYKGGITVTAVGARKNNCALHFTPIEYANSNPGTITNPDFNSVHIAPKFTAARLGRDVYITGQYTGFGLAQANYTQFTRLTSLDYDFTLSTTGLGVLVLRSS
jgi:hypothetical protein